MIVPNNRLLLWTGLIFLPFSALVTAVSSAAFISFGFIAILVFISIADALAGSGRGRDISVSLPEIIRLSKGRDATIDIAIRNINIPVRKMRIGLALPSEIYSPAREMITRLEAGVPDSIVCWPCKGTKHGFFTINKCYLEIDSPLGLWASRRTFETNAEIRIYPNLISDRNKLSAFVMNRKSGVHSQRQIGKGRDFERLREYVPSDNYEDIYWKATAKHRFPVSKIYQIERSQDIYIIIDFSRLSARIAENSKVYSSEKKAEQKHEDSAEESILDRYIAAALITGISAEKHGDLFGIITFANKVQGIVKAKNGKAHYNSCRDMLYTLQPENVTPDFSELFTFIGTRLRKRALLIFLTNLDDPVLAGEFIRNVNIISRRHLVIVSMMKPKGANPLFSSHDVDSVDDIYKNFGGHFLWKSLNETEKLLKQYRIGFSLLDNENMFTQLISQYLNIKQRQIL
ncbi:MAG: DUF58 domain-containing protein [Desulfobacterales bacterium]|nr:DUF58 domain-containing protein [Desulfobacterales bacterium]